MTGGQSKKKWVAKKEVEKEAEKKEVKNEEVKEVNEEESPQKVVFARIQYIVTDQFKRFCIGSTSFRKDYDVGRSREISVVFFDSLPEAENYFDNLTNFKDERIVESYFVCNSGVMIELVNCDIQKWFDEELKAFKTTCSGVTWWAHIGQSFKSICRDILLALQFLFERGAYCGELVENISVINGKSAKLCQVKVADGDLRARIWDDIIDLKHLMVKVLFEGHESGGGYSNKDLNRLVEMGIPYALTLFLEYLGDHFVRDNWDIQWLLDESFFWDNVKRYSLVRKVYDNMRNFGSPGIHKAMEHMLGESSLKSFFTPGSTEEIVYEYGLRQQLEVEQDVIGSDSNRRHCIVYRDNIFLGVVLCYENLVEHYNDYSPQALSTNEIIGLADSLFRGGCSMIRNAMAEDSFRDKQRRDLSFFLSKTPY